MKMRHYQLKILIATFYREWQQPNQSDHYSKTVQAQFERWCNFLTKWEVVFVEGKEVIVIGDLNVDFLKWTRTDLGSSDSTSILKPLFEALFSRILPNGVTQLVKEPTRISSGQLESGLDHIYSNRPDKCSEIYGICRWL